MHTGNQQTISQMSITINIGYNSYYDLYNKVSDYVKKISLIPVRFFLLSVIFIILWIVFPFLLLDVLIHLRNYFLPKKIYHANDVKKAWEIKNKLSAFDTFHIPFSFDILYFLPIFIYFYILRQCYKRSKKIIQLYDKPQTNNAQILKFVSMTEISNTRCNAYDYLM